MAPTLVRRALVVLAVVAVLGVLVWSFRPRPLLVDLATVTRGPMQVTVEDEGETRVRERYVVSAPIAGNLRRITLDPGDAVAAGETVVAVVDPSEAALLDPRTRAETESLVRARRAALTRAEAQRAAALAAREQARRDLERTGKLAETGDVSREALEQARLLERTRGEELAAAEAALSMARYELEMAETTLSRGTGESHGSVEVRSPVGGLVLRVVRESAGPVAAGAPLLEVGDLDDLEVVTDLLSSDAVQVRPGMPATIERWGGEPLAARVRRVEPSGFTKVSALGVEEQRVDVRLDLVAPPAERPHLGDGFRVEAVIVVWRTDDALRVPASALFRREGRWAVFRADDGTARSTDIEVGRMNGLEAEVLGGLADGDEVIVHPGDDITEGSSVAPRAT